MVRRDPDDRLSFEEILERIRMFPRIEKSHKEVSKSLSFTGNFAPK